MNATCPKCKAKLIRGETTQIRNTKHTLWVCPTCHKVRGVE